MAEPATDEQKDAMRLVLIEHESRMISNREALSLIARIEAETARADEMGRMVTLTEKTLVTRSNRIAELTERAESAENIASQLQDQRKRIAELGATVNALIEKQAIAERFIPDFARLTYGAECRDVNERLRDDN